MLKTECKCGVTSSSKSRTSTGRRADQPTMSSRQADHSKAYYQYSESVASHGCTGECWGGCGWLGRFASFRAEKAAGDHEREVGGAPFGLPQPVSTAHTLAPHSLGLISRSKQIKQSSWRLARKQLPGSPSGKC